MTAEEALQSVREARQRMMDGWKGKSDEEIVALANESARRVMAEVEQRRQAKSTANEPKA